MIDRRLSGAVAVAGVGASEQGTFPEEDQYSLAVTALLRALDDCGLQKDDVDGLVAAGPGDISFARLGEMLGLRPRFSTMFPIGGLSTGALIQQAVLVIDAGMADVVALVYGNASRTEGRTFGGSPFATPGIEYADSAFVHGMTSPGAASAFQARMYFDAYGATSEQLAWVPVIQRRHAARNPRAIKREPLTVEGHQQSRFVVEPLRLYDYCLINDGGVALILTSTERARALRAGAVPILGVGRADDFHEASHPSTTMWRDTLAAATGECLAMAGVGREEVDLLYAYDSFSVNVWLTLEGCGFCGEGEAAAFCAEGRIELGADLPVNSHGGHLSESYMQGWLHQVEAVTQLRGAAGERQADRAGHALYAARGNVATTVLYGRDA